MRHVRAVFLLPAARADAPRGVRRALAIRRQATVAGRCPGCGAHRERRTHTFVVEHGTACPASDGLLARLLREHAVRATDLHYDVVVADVNADGAVWQCQTPSDARVPHGGEGR